MYIPGRVGLPRSPLQGALAAAKQSQPLDTRMRQKHPASCMGQAANTRMGAGSVNGLVGRLVSRLPRTWLPLVPSSPTDVYGCFPLPQLSRFMMHYFQYSIFLNAHSNTGGTCRIRLAGSLLFLHCFPMDLVLHTVLSLPLP